MTVREQTCFIAQCDECGTDYERDYTPHWNSTGGAIDDAVSGGEWWSNDTLLMCDSCKLIPHAFVPSDLLADDCDRCELAQGEHEVAKP